MLFPDHEIDRLVRRGSIGVDPYDDDLLNPCSLDVRLSRHFRIPRQSIHHIDMAEVPVGHTELVESPTLIIKPGEFLLGSTYEIVTMPDDITARLEGKSSVGRVGLSIHITAGWVDCGFDGAVTLEIKNEAPWALTLHEGMRIAQLAFFEMHSPAAKPYGQTGRYLDQKDRAPKESRYTHDLSSV